MKFLFALTIFSLSFQSIAAPPTDTLTIGIGAEFESLHPTIANQAASKYMYYPAWRPMIVMSPKNEWIPLLIKEIPTLQNKRLKKVGSTLEATIEILPQVKWGDGTPATCKDVELGWEIGANYNVSNPDREPYDQISGVQTDTKNPKKCVITFKTVKYDYVSNFPNMIPAHVEREIYEKYKNENQGYDKNSQYTKNPTNPALYLGPYVISDVKLGSHLILTPNPHFAGRKPHFKKIVFKLIPNNGTLVTNLKAGTIDMISPAAGLSLDQALVFDRNVKAENLPYNVVFVDGNIYAHMDFNLDHPILKDVRVRKALAHGFNRVEAIQSLLEGKGQMAINNVTKTDPFYSEKGNKYPFNRREANRLLDEAGWKRGADGVRAKDGKRLSLVVMGAAGTKLIEMTQAYLQAQWKEIGVELLIKNEPARVYFGETLRKRNFELAMYSWVAFPEITPRGQMHSKSIPTAENSFGGNNLPGWKNAEVDKLIDQLELELDAKKRKAMGQKVVEIYMNELPVLPIYYRSNFSVIPRAMKGYELPGTIFYDTLFVENWTMAN